MALSVRTRRQAAVATGASATGRQALGAMAIGALAAGAVALGALAIGRLFVGRLKVRHAVFDQVSIGTLRIQRLVIDEEGRP